MLTLVHVLEWRAAVQPGQVAVSAALREPFWAGRAGRDRRVS